MCKIKKWNDITVWMDTNIWYKKFVIPAWLYYIIGICMIALICALIDKG